MTEEQSKKLFKSLDQKNRGKIEFEDFCVLMHHPNSLNWNDYYILYHPLHHLC